MSKVLPQRWLLFQPMPIPSQSSSTFECHLPCRSNGSNYRLHEIVQGILCRTFRSPCIEANAEKKAMGGQHHLRSPVGSKQPAGLRPGWWWRLPGRARSPPTVLGRNLDPPHPQHLHAAFSSSCRDFKSMHMGTSSHSLMQEHPGNALILQLRRGVIVSYP